MKRFFFILLLCTITSAKAQDILKKASSYVESSAFISTGGTIPNFLRTNNYGEVPLNGPFFQLKGNFHTEYDSLYNINGQLNKSAIAFGLTAVANVGATNEFLISEGYVKYRRGVFEVYAGRRKEFIGLGDTTGLHSSYIWSGNALPIPKIQIGIPNYTPILGKGLISVKGFYAHGWFGNADSVQNYFLHQKQLYFQVGRPNWKIKLQAGFNHQVQWGGRPTVPFYDPLSERVISKFDADISTYIKVVTGVSLNKNFDGLETGGPANEALNRAGNHLGSIDVNLQIQVPHGHINIYRQSFYEDGSLFYLSNIGDGYFGVDYTNRGSRKSIRISKISIAYLSTLSQGGVTDSEFTIPELRGRDNYFNNSIYKDNWTYKRNTLGTPYITPKYVIDSKIDNVNVDNRMYLINNRIEVYELYGSISWQDKILLNIKYGFSKNLGTYAYPFEGSKIQTMGTADFRFLFRDNQFGVSVAMDNGSLYPSQVGAILSYRKVIF